MKIRKSNSSLNSIQNGENEIYYHCHAKSLDITEINETETFSRLLADQLIKKHMKKSTTRINIYCLNDRLKFHKLNILHPMRKYVLYHDIMNFLVFNSKPNVFMLCIQDSDTNKRSYESFSCDKHQDLEKLSQLIGLAKQKPDYKLTSDYLNNRNHDSLCDSNRTFTTNNERQVNSLNIESINPTSYRTSDVIYSNSSIHQSPPQHLSHLNETENLIQQNNFDSIDNSIIKLNSTNSCSIVPVQSPVISKTESWIYNNQNHDNLIEVQKNYSLNQNGKQSIIDSRKHLDIMNQNKQSNRPRKSNYTDDELNNLINYKIKMIDQIKYYSPEKLNSLFDNELTFVSSKGMHSFESKYGSKYLYCQPGSETIQPYLGPVKQITSNF